MSDNTSFSQQVAFLNRGELDDELTQELSELIQQVRLTRKGGAITLKLSVKMADQRTEDRIQIMPSVTVKRPELDRESAILWSTADGDLLRNDPRQVSLDLKEVPQIEIAEPREIKSV